MKDTQKSAKSTTAVDKASKGFTDEERAACLEFLTEQAARFAKPAELVAFTAGEENPVKPAADPHQRARENLIHVLLNHNDFLTVR